MATRDHRSRVQVDALSYNRGQDEIEKGKVGEGKLLIFFRIKLHSLQSDKIICILIMLLDVNLIAACPIDMLVKCNHSRIILNAFINSFFKSLWLIPYSIIITEV